MDFFIVLILNPSFPHILTFSHHPQRPQQPPVLLSVFVCGLAALGSALVFSQEVKQSVEPRVEGRQGPGDLIAHRDHGHGVTGDPFGHFKEEEDGSGHVEGEEAESEEEGDGDDGLNGFTSAVGIRRVGAQENGNPFRSSRCPR